MAQVTNNTQLIKALLALKTLDDCAIIDAYLAKNDAKLTTQIRKMLEVYEIQKELLGIPMPQNTP